jgi:ribosome maturation protein Sdo1
LSNRIIRHGNQGILNTASKATLENEFGTSNEDEVMKQILQKGNVQQTQVCFTP